MICLLDLDGTLIDSTKRHWVLMQRLLQRHCPDLEGSFDPAVYMQYKADGHSGKQYLTNILHLEETKAREIQKEWQEQIEEEEYLELDVLYEDTLPFLQERKQKGESIVYLTARKNTLGLYRELEQLKIAAYAEQVIVVNPSAAKAEKIAATRALLTSDPQVMLIGDTENEQAVAEATGIRGYLLHRGFRSRRYWEAKEQDTYGSLKEIP